MSKNIIKKIRSGTERLIDNSPMEYIRRPLFTVSGNKELIAQGDISVEKYGEEEMRMNVSRTSVTVLGRGLTMCFYNKHTVQLSGYILSISFDEA